MGVSYWRTRWLFQRGLAGIYLVAFLDAVNQFPALLGTHGLLPVPFFVQQVPFLATPSLFYLHYSDGFMLALAWLGAALALAALAGLSERFGTPVSMAVWAVLWLLYQSFVNVGQVFYSFGWETLLLEAGFLAIFLGGRTTAPPVTVIWLLRWLLVRLMFGAGLIKLRGDACWRDLTCLVHHYETQPMPNPLSWYLHHLPVPVHKLGVLFNYLAELVAPPACLSTNVAVRRVAGGIIVVFQLLLILSGNLSWLNWLTMVIAVSCFDDRVLARLTPNPPEHVEPPPRPLRRAALALATVVALLSIAPVFNMISPRQMMNASFEPLHLVNTYGAFGSVSEERFEVVFEGTSDDSITPATRWREYAFKAQPGDLARTPPVVAPYHLRLDWLMWFAGLDRRSADPWMAPLVARLLQADGPTLELMEGNPFPERPPRYIRARLYRYRFTSAAEHRRTGDWWSRELVDEYVPPLSLDTPGLLEELAAQGWQR